jgi:hypothetical protein
MLSRYHALVYVSSGGADTSSWIVAGGTALLALATFWLAWRTGVLARETRQGIDATAVQFRQERMPVVMPVAERSGERAGNELRVVTVGEPVKLERIPKRLPYLIDGGERNVQAVNVPIENVGAGPALGIAGTLVFLDTDGAVPKGPQPLPFGDGNLAGLGPGKMAWLRFEYWAMTAPLLSYLLTLTYQDGAGGAYRVTSVFLEGKLAYGPVGFEPPQELQLPGGSPVTIPMPQGYVDPSADLTPEGDPDGTKA